MKNEMRRLFCYLFELSKKNKNVNGGDKKNEFNERRTLYFSTENALKLKYKKAVIYKNIDHLKKAMHQWIYYLLIIRRNNKDRQRCTNDLKSCRLQKFQNIFAENEIQILEKEEKVMQ